MCGCELRVMTKTLQVMHKPRGSTTHLPTHSGNNKFSLAASVCVSGSTGVMWPKGWCTNKSRPNRHF